ncbi:sensor histidine kinase [Actinophytocola sp.]|uniref:sensor histidine kinase n=1 Tax=Actinophytocola sp. TaxID=1872138 RepID=UPI002ED6673B
MAPWHRFARLAGIVLGGAGLLVAFWHAFAIPGEDGVLGGLSWLGIGVAPLYVVSVWVISRRPEHPQARRLLLMGSSLAVSVAVEGLVQDAVRRSGAGTWLWWPNLIYQYSGVLSLISGVLLLGCYPDGVVERAWQRRALRLVWLYLLVPPLLLLSRPTLLLDRYLFELPPPVASPFTVSWLGFLDGPLTSLYVYYYGALVLAAVLFVRFVQADHELRAKMRLLVYVTALLIAMTALTLALEASYGADRPLWVRLLNGLYIMMLLMVPVTIVIGIVRHRLFEMEPVVRRSTVFTVLSLLIAGAYLGVAAAPGLTLGREIPVELAVAITIVAAVAFQPLRRRLERLADRLVFGERVNRYHLLTTFGARLEQTVELGDLLPQLAATIHEGLGARWVRVTLPEASAVVGEPAGEPALRVPLERGHIECGPRDGGYAPEDRELLRTLATQAATAIANVQLTARLAEQVDELARSRARIVAAQDSERRRIERDIHDGAQQHLVALIMKLRLARNQIGRGERSADDVLDELQGEARDLLADLRELAHGIHPPVLSDQGLVVAVQARADRLPLDIRVHADAALRAERLHADVEGAAYFVICEALTNVVKHSAARSAGIELSMNEGLVTVRVHDDGVGLADGQRGGVGLTNLRDRVEALGGRLTVHSEPGAGTSVRAELPVGASHG